MTQTYTPPPWSYSAITSFETCAKRHFHIKVAKDVADVKSVATTWGTTVHEHLEHRARDNTQLPPELSQFEPLVKLLEGVGGQMLVEHKMAVTSSFEPTEWTADDAWCRGIVDIGVLSGKTAVLLDWKTGKRKPDSDQLKLFAALTFAHFPQIERAATGFVWAKDGRIDVEKFTRSDVLEIWRAFSPRVARFVRAYESASFPAKPSGLCNPNPRTGYAGCSVPNKLCKYSSRF